MLTVLIDCFEWWLVVSEALNVLVLRSECGNEEWEASPIKELEVLTALESQLE